MIAPPLDKQLRDLEARARAQGVPGSMLAWWGRSDLPDGASQAPALTQGAWESVYAALRQAALTPAAVEPFFMVKRRSAAQRPDDALRVGIANFQVAVPEASFRRRVMEAAHAGVALEPPPGEPATVISLRRVFAACALMMRDRWAKPEPVVRGLQVSFWLDPGFYFTNPGAERPESVELDCGDGLGPRTVRFGDTVEARYRAPGAVTAALSCRVGGATLSSEFQILVEDAPAAPAPDETWPLSASNGAKGKAYVFRAHGRAAVTNPVIVAEGFPGGYSPDYLYDMINQHGMGEGLRAAGYDLVFLGYANGLDRIENNAQVAIECIREAMRRTGNPLVVGGVSMGGLVTRYALTFMEAMGWPHQTRIYLSIDSPHRGSYTNLCAQWFAQYFATSSPAAQLQAMVLASPANQQFVATWLDKGAVQTSKVREEFVTSLRELGDYPQKPRRIAVSSGRGDGKRSHAPYQPALSWTGSPFIGAELRTLPEGAAPEVVATGHSFRADPKVADTLRFASDVSWEGAPGGQNVYNQLARDIAADLGCGDVSKALSPTCSVPTVSALDLSFPPFEPVPKPGGSASPFHDYICCETNQHHVQFTPAVKDWLVQQLGNAPATQPGRPRMAFDPSKFDPHLRAFLEDPYPFYAEFRRDAPVCMVNPYQSYWVFRHKDVKTILEKKELYLKNPVTSGPSTMPLNPFDVLDYMPDGIFSMDPPDHTRQREVLERLFEKAIADAKDVATQKAQELLKNAKASSRIELVSEYAAPLPPHILLTIFGIPPTHHALIVQWVTGILAGHDITSPVPARITGGTCAFALGTYYQALQRGCPVPPPGNRMFEQMVGAVAEKKMTAEEVQQTSINFSVAGYPSATFLIATGMLNLIRNPDQLKLLRDKPELLGSAIEEMLRYDAPAQLVDRYVAEDTELGGVKLKKNTKVTAVLGSANRDPDAFDKPDAFNIERKGPHLGFGTGIHHCIGAPLVRMTAPVAFGALLKTFSTLAVEGLPQWQTDPYLRSVVNLPLAVG